MRRIFIASFLVLSLGSFAQSQGNLQVNEEAGIATLRRQYKTEGAKMGIDGFWVQIFNGKLKAAEGARANFVKFYPEIKVRTIYESPEYKVQVGGFRSKMEAERFLASLDPSFQGSFVIRGKIYP